MNIRNQSSPGELGLVVLFCFLDCLVLADFKFRLENYLNPNGLNGCSWALLRAVTLNSHCMVMIGISSQRLMRIFSYIDTCKSQAVLG